MMQQVTDSLIAGFDAMWHPQQLKFVYSYGMKYQFDHHSFFAQFMPVNPREKITLGYVTKPSRHVNLFGELKLSDAGSESTYGFKMNFNSGQVTGTMSSKWKAGSQILFMLDQMLQVQASTIMDLSKPEKPVQFGIGVSFGGG